MALPRHIKRQGDPVVAFERAGRNGSIQDRGNDRINRGDITLLGLASVGSSPLAGVDLDSGNRHALAIRLYVGDAVLLRKGRQSRRRQRNVRVGSNAPRKGLGAVGRRYVPSLPRGYRKRD